MSSSSLYESVVKEFSRAADLMGLDPGCRCILETPQREHVMRFPVTLDNGTVQVFEGIRVQHNDWLGPYKGGLRFHPEVNIDEARALATWMTIKNAIANLPLGGGKGVLKIDPTKYSREELRRISHRFGIAIAEIVGPGRDIPAPDVGTNGQIMAWLTDAVQLTRPVDERHKWRATFTGKPVGLGGSLGREKATGQGVVNCIKRWASDAQFPLQGATFIVQGFGNVGSWTAKILQQEGLRLLAVNDKTGSIMNPNGIDADDLALFVARTGGVSGYPSAKSIERSEFFATKADIFIPAALEHQITRDTAPLLDVKLVAEGGNGPTDPEGDAILLAKNIPVIPDVLCNSGGVIVSYFEWVQNLKHEHWSLKEVDEKLLEIITGGYDRVKANVEKYKTGWRTAAYITALERLECVYKLQGVWP